MARWRPLLQALRIVAAVVFVIVAIWLFVLAWHIPIEMGGIIFVPLCCGMGVLLFWVGVGLLFPSVWRGKGGVAFWAGIADLFNPF